jgi:hypothetical protein
MLVQSNETDSVLLRDSSGKMRHTKACRAFLSVPFADAEHSSLDGDPSVRANCFVLFEECIHVGHTVGMWVLWESELEVFRIHSQG